MPKLGDAKVYGFRYDQLNRLKAMNAYEWLNNSTNSFSAITLDDYMERLTYDANGNILSYIRNGFGAGIAMNDYSYTYEAGSNRLWELYNSAGGGHSYSYEYDEIGNVTLDSKQGVDAAEWNLYGKLKAVTKSGTDIEYSYDAGGQRISKKVNSTEEWYVKDATGNIMATYIKATLVNSGHLSTKEFNKYGSDLLGTEKLVIDVQTPPSPPEIVTFERGITDYLLNDHRGNNMSMVTDKKLQHSTDGATIDYYLADVRTASYYSAYGAISKSFNDGQIDLAHNRQKRSLEISESAQTALYWEYNGDVGVRWNVDPVYKNGSYTCFAGNPIYLVDFIGLDTVPNWKEAKVGDIWGNVSGNSTFYYKYNGKTWESNGSVTNLSEPVVVKSKTLQPSKDESRAIANSSLTFKSEYGNGTVRCSKVGFKVLFSEFKNNDGPVNSIFAGNHPLTKKVRDEVGEIERLRFFMYQKYNGCIPANGSYTNFAAYGGTFLPWYDNFSVAPQFIGTFSGDVFVSEDGKRLVFVISDSKSATSFFYRLADDHDRKWNDPDKYANTYQKYVWEEPIDPTYYSREVKNRSSDGYKWCPECWK